MAALSTLVLNQSALHKEPFEEERTPTTPVAGNRLPTPKLSETKRPDRHPRLAETSDQPADDAKDPQTSGHPKPDPMDLDESDPENDASDIDGEQGEGDGSSKKKKGQRFFCTGYPPCNLSFTRSEHLARHIRKHTGERPFQCHCNRRFSRLDNLRQHAQTVHINEEIPTDSLAATGTRYQRQVRTDRVRPPGRPRTGTMSSTGTHSRGHSRNLSTSSIGSTSSNFSTTTTDTRRRPPPLLMAGDGSNRPSTPPSQFSAFATNSPGDLSTPNSATFSMPPSSPGFGPGVGSPVSSQSRLASYYGEARGHNRRLSVPSSSNLSSAHYGTQYPLGFGSYGSQLGPATSNSSSVVTSPTSSTFSFVSGFQPPSNEDWRRRTWHPSTYPNINYNYGRPATSGLTYSQTPDAPQPAYAQNATAAAGHAPRLPGIESFDHVQHHPSTPPRRNASPVRPDNGGRQRQLMPAPEFEAPRPTASRREDVRKGNYPDIDERTGRVATPWGQQTLEQINSISRPIPHSPQPMRPYHQPPAAAQPSQQITQEALNLQSARRPKHSHHNSWANGPGPAVRTSPEDSSSSEGVPTPSASQAEVHPTIVQYGGPMESHHPIMTSEAQSTPCLSAPLHVEHHRPGTHSQPRVLSSHEIGSRANDMNRLEALVAVATSENTANRRPHQI